MLCSGGCTDTSASAADTSSPSSKEGYYGGGQSNRIEQEAQSVKEEAAQSMHNHHPPIEEEPMVLQQRSPSPPLVALATAAAVTAVESPAESSGPALEPMRLAFDTVEAPVRHRSVVIAQEKVDNKVEKPIHVHQRSINSSEGVSEVKESSASEVVVPQEQQQLPKIPSTAALLRLKRAVVQRQAVQLASSLSTQSENSSVPQRSSIGMVSESAETMNTPAPPRPAPTIAAAAATEPVQETAAASTTSRPYLKRRSQAIPIQPPP